MLINFLKKNFWLLTIITLAFSLRFYKLAQVPTGLYIDEISIAYNAYTISETGKDEHGVSWPLWFESFGEYKMPVYIYATAFWTKLLGRGELAVRVTSTIAGTLSVIFIYLLSKQIFPNKKQASTAIWAALLFAITPWSLHFSKVGFEANLALLFVITGAWQLIVGLKQARLRPILLATTLFLLSTFTYNSARLVAPLLALTIILWQSASLKKNYKNLKVAIIFSLILLLPTIPGQIKSGFARLSATSVASQTTPPKAISQIVKQSIDHFDTNFLFFQGGFLGRHSTKKSGVLPYISAPLILIGVYSLAKKDKKIFIFLTTWLLISTIPAAITKPSPHSLRSLNMLPAWTILAGFGAAISQNRIKKINNKVFSISSLLFLIVFTSYSTLIYLHDYYTRYHKVTAIEWESGSKEAIQAALQIADDQTIYITDQIPVLHAAYFSQTDPQTYQELDKKRSTDLPTMGPFEYFNNVTDIDKEKLEGSIFITPTWQKPHQNSKFTEIFMANGDLRFYVWEYHADS